MGDLIIALEGTAAGEQLAMILALCAALLHAVFGALQKGRHDPLLSRGAIDSAMVVLVGPVALFIVPWPEPHMWPIFAGMFIIHAGYKWAVLSAFRRGAYTVVYPVMRGTGPLFTVIGAGILFGEVFTLGQWIGVGVLITGLYGLAAYNIATVTIDRETLISALGFAVLTGLFVALYTNYDAYGIRATADPFTFLAWFFFMALPCLVLPMWRGGVWPTRLRSQVWLCAGSSGPWWHSGLSGRSCWPRALTMWARRPCCARRPQCLPR